MKAVLSRLRKPQIPKRAASTQVPTKIPKFGPGLHDYTSGRYLFNETLRLKERHLQFNAHELAHVICSTLGRPLEDLQTLDKFAEGGFNRLLQARFSDGKEILVRLPFHLEAPLQHSVASEAATLSYLYQQSIPVPKVLGYSPVNENSVGIEYILLEKLQGQPLGDRWFSLENKAVAKIMKQIVDIEQKYMRLPLPASGSLYFQRDLQENEHCVPLVDQSQDGSRFVIGPIASYAWQYRERALLDVDRGPWHDFRSCIEAAAKRELAYCQTYGKPRLNVELYLRELDDLQLQQPSHHAQLLQDYLRLASSLDLSPGSRFSRPTLRHPDLSPNNILINDENEIVGLIDWQHTVVMPLCLCAGIPNHYQNWGDPISETLQKPDTKLPENFDSLDPASQDAARETMRRRLVHFYYAALNLKIAEDHYDAFRDQNAMLRAKLYARAGAPWEGSSTSLEQVLIQAQELWPLSLEGSSSTNISACPIRYSPERIESCKKKAAEEEEKLEELDDMRGMLGTDALGWVENDEHLAHAKELREAMRSGFLKGCETEMELRAVREHFPFDDHEE